VGVGFLVTEEQTFDKGAPLELHLRGHFLHIENGLVLIELVGDLEVGECLEAFLPVSGDDLGHVGII
jgi:hypothetical protein